MTNAVYIKTPAKPNSYTYSYYQNDHLGTPQQLLSFNSATVWQGEYDAFGEISITNNQIPQPLRFAGQYHDSESNLYYNWHRYYNPKLGRYISSDPIGLDGGMNRFGYTNGNSLRFFDIYGLLAMEDIGGKVCRVIGESCGNYGKRVTKVCNRVYKPGVLNGLCGVLGVEMALECQGGSIPLCPVPNKPKPPSCKK